MLYGDKRQSTLMLLLLLPPPPPMADDGAVRDRGQLTRFLHHGG